MDQILNQHVDSETASLDEASLTVYDNVEQQDYVDVTIPSSGVQDLNDDNVCTTPPLLDNDEDVDQHKDVSRTVADYYDTEMYEEIPAEIDNEFDTYVSLENIDQSENEVYQDVTMISNGQGQVFYQTSNHSNHDEEMIERAESDIYTTLGPGEGPTVYQTRDLNTNGADDGDQDTQEKVTELKNKFSVTRKGIVIVIRIPFNVSRNIKAPLVIVALITLCFILLSLVIALVVGISTHYI